MKVKELICHCDVCNYTFEASVLNSKYPVPKRCPDCGKMVTKNGNPAVRAATEPEIAEYEKNKKLTLEEMYDELNGGITQ